MFESVDCTEQETAGDGDEEGDQEGHTRPVWRKVQRGKRVSERTLCGGTKIDGRQQKGGTA